MKSDQIQIGDKPPDFTLPAIDGTTITLSERGRQTILLVFYRGHW